MLVFSVCARLLVFHCLLSHCTSLDTLESIDLGAPAPQRIPASIQTATVFATQDGGYVGATQDGDEFGATQDGVDFGATQDGVEFGATQYGVDFGVTQDGVDFGAKQEGENVLPTNNGDPPTEDTVGNNTNLEQFVIEEKPNSYFFYDKRNFTADSVHLSGCTIFCQKIGFNGECVDDAICFFKTLVSLADPGRISENMELWSTINTPDDVHQIVQVKGIKNLVRTEMKYVDELSVIITRVYEQLIINESERDKAGNKSAECCTGPCEKVDEYDGACVLQADCFFKSYLHIVETDKNRHLLDLSGLPSYRNGHLFAYTLFERLKLEKERLDSFGKSVIAAYDKMVDIIRENNYQYGEYQHLLKYGQQHESEIASDIVSSGTAVCRAVCAVADNNGDCRLDVGCFMRSVSYKPT